MLHRIIALVAIFTVTLTGFNQPALAATQSTPGLLGDRFTFENASIQLDFSSQSDFLFRQVQNLIDGAVYAVGGMAGGAAICYAADAAATTVFPPAAALAPFCPALPSLVGGTAAAARVAIRTAT